MNIPEHVSWNKRARGQQTSSAKGQIVNILGFAGHKISTATTQIWCCTTKAAKSGM